MTSGNTCIHFSIMIIKSRKLILIIIIKIKKTLLDFKRNMFIKSSYEINNFYNFIIDSFFIVCS